MEIELKYNIPNMEDYDSIWENKLFAEYEEEDSREELHLNAKYYDTDDFALAKNEIAYRIRKEGDELVAALKWKGHSENGLHVREEINIPVRDFEPDPEVFLESRVGSEAMALLLNDKLQCVMETIVDRKRFRIDSGKGIYEISLDKGQVVTAYGSVPLCEVEIELFSGPQEDLIEIGRRLQEAYELIPEDTSKYGRGMDIIREHQ